MHRKLLSRERFEVLSRMPYWTFPPMARSDLLLSLVKAGVAGDQSLFRKTVEALIAEERWRNHSVLAGRLAEQLSRNGSPPRPIGIPTANGAVQDLFYEATPQRSIEDLILPEPVQQACAELVEDIIAATCHVVTTSPRGIGCY